MSRSHRVVWGEGMLLSPQHLQQWDRYVHELVGSRLRSTHAFDWGFTRLTVDEEALRNGRFELSAVEGVFEDGTPFSAPGRELLPAPRLVDPHLQARQDSALVYLGLPIPREGIPQVGELKEPGKQGPRYAAVTVPVRDLCDGTSEREVTLATPNLCVLFPDDALGEYDKLPVAEIVRAGDKSYRLRHEFIPPVLHASASLRLMELLDAVLKLAIARSNELSDSRHQTGAVADFAAGDLRAACRLYAYNAMIPALRHFYGVGRVHPEDVFLALSMCLGQLSTFSTEFWAKELPEYDHRGLGRTFEDLSRLFQGRPEDPTQSRRLDLHKIDDYMYSASIPDPALLAPGVRYFLGAKADAEDEWLRVNVPDTLKVASPGRIEVVVRAALRGIPLQRLARIPAESKALPRHVYFELDCLAEEWGAVRSEQAIAISGVLGAAGLHLDLVALRP